MRKNTLRRKIVEGVEAYFRAHIVQPVALQPLCEIMGVSQCTLRNAFYDVHGMSPKRYMLRMRLDGAHEALRHGEQHATVTEVATRYGFFELGRFAQRYKVVFGERPSDTLRTAIDQPWAHLSETGPRRDSHDNSEIRVAM